MAARPGDIIAGDQDEPCAFPPSLAEEAIGKALRQRDSGAATIRSILETRRDRSFADALEARCAN